MSCDCPSVLERIHTLETTIEVLRQKCLDTREELERLATWIHQDTEKSRWFYQVEHDLRELVESKRWVGMLRRAVAWLVGATVGALMMWHEIEQWIKTNKWWQ